MEREVHDQSMTVTTSNGSEATVELKVYDQSMEIVAVAVYAVYRGS